MSGAQCWTLLLAHWALSGGRGQVSLGEWSPGAEPVQTSTPAPKVTLLMSPLGGGRGQGPTGIHWVGHPSFSIIKTLLYRGHFGEQSHRTQVFSYFFPI